MRLDPADWLREITTPFLELQNPFKLESLACPAAKIQFKADFLRNSHVFNRTSLFSDAQRFHGVCFKKGVFGLEGSLNQNFSKRTITVKEKSRVPFKKGVLGFEAEQPNPRENIFKRAITVGDLNQVKI